MSDPREVSVELLRSLTPLEGMKRGNLHALAKKGHGQGNDGGPHLFKEGDTDKRTIWIIKGLVEISENGRTVGMIEGGSADCARAAQPERAAQGHGARGGGRGLPGHRLRPAGRDDHLGPDRQLRGRRTAVAIRRRRDDSDWMTTLLQTKAFHRIPPANLQAIFMRMNRSQYRPAKWSSSRATKATTSTPSCRAAAS
jgi:hypothetical protein